MSDVPSFRRIVTGNSTFKEWFLLWMFAGPCLVALHFMAGRGLLSFRRRRYLAGSGYLLGIGFSCAFLPLLVIAIAQWPYLGSKPPPSIVLRTDAQVKELTLRHEGYASANPARDERPPAPLLTARGAHLSGQLAPTVHFEKQTRQVIGHRAVRSSPWDGTPSRYIVTESLLPETSNRSWPWRTEVVIEDRQTRQLLAKRVWFRTNDSSNQRDGWSREGGQRRKEGQPSAREEAHRFVDEVLNTQRPQFPPPVSITPQVLDVLPATILSDKDFYASGQGCGDRAVIGGSGREGIQLALDAAGWSLATDTRLLSVFCHDNEVFVFSEDYLSKLKLDWLAASGRIKGQYALEYRHEGRRTDCYVTSFYIEMGRITLNRLCRRMSDRGADIEKKLIFDLPTPAK